MLVKIGIAVEMKGVSPSTLRRWEKEEKTRPVGRTIGGHRRYKLIHLLGKMKGEEKRKKFVLGNARASSSVPVD